MLKLTDIRKSYTTANFTQTALDGVNIAFRHNEFAAVLGPSGSGKTTLLNIIGGLDHYDSGDLEIDGVSTKKYADRDWDTYRNNRIGFVFQSYNLIPHQSVLSNVELALTLSGVSSAERRERAIQALEEVGLGDHIRKKPNQLSGGQMQRVAIARALINDPEILLADEPTGALDTRTGEQVMDLLTKIAENRLVVMVTHNNELAEQYATRIIHLTDGQVTADSRPFDPDLEEERPEPETRKASMSFWTAVSLSFSNLMTKKGRTFVTALAGSIGIIGIAAIMALANGINVYIEDVERETLSIYPLTIQESGFDYTSLFTDFTDTFTGDGDEDDDEEGIREQRIVETLFSNQSQNDLTSLKAFLDESEEEIDPYVNSIQYVYDVTPQIYLADTSDGVDQVNPDSILSSFGMGNSLMDASGMSGMSMFYEMPGELDMFEHQYDVVAGRWPQSYDEMVLVLSSDGSISDYSLYMMGLRDRDELRTLLEAYISGTETEISDDGEEAILSYDTLLETEYKLVLPADQYQYDREYRVWLDKSGDEQYMKDLVDNGITLSIVGIVQPDPDATASSLSSGINYTPDLIQFLMEEAAESEIVQDQLARPTVNVLSGSTFAEENAESDDMGFDFADLIEIDEDVFEEAFDFDADDMDLDLSDMGLDMDLGSMGMSMDSIDLSGIDLSGMDFDMSGLDMSGLDMPEFEFDINELTESIAAEIDIPAEALYAIMAAVLEDFIREELAAGVTSPDQIMADLPAYLERPEVQASINEQLALLIDPSAVEDQVTEAVGRYIEAAMVAYMEQMMGSLEAYMATYMEAVMQSYMNGMMDLLQNQLMGELESQIMGQMEAATDQVMDQFTDYFATELPAQLMGAMDFDMEALAGAFQLTVEEEELLALMQALMSSEDSTLARNLTTLGYADPAEPTQINIYPMDFSAKEEIMDILDDYNARMEAAGEPEKVVYFTDLVGVMMSSVTDIINTISYALIAFVAISLVVSSIMIGVVTYISVLERKKEIGILRAIGASKGNIRQVFNAETLIIGFVAGLLGIVVTLLICIPANIIVESRFGIAGIAQLPPAAGVGLIGISMLLTFVSGLIPSSAAARRDPVEALRSE